MPKTPEIGYPYSLLWPGKRVVWRGGGRTMISPGRPEIMGRPSPIKAPRFPNPNRGAGFLNFGDWRILFALAAVWK